MNIRLVFLIVSIVFGVAAFGVAIYDHLTQATTAYVDLIKLHDEFQLKKELSQEIEKVRLLKKNELDSLKLDYEIAVKRNASKETIAEKARIYQFKDQQISKDFETLAQNYEQKVWTQLNLYADKFGEEHHIDFLMGLQGNGSMMHSNKKYDKTEELIQYANQMYSGKGTK